MSQRSELGVTNTVFRDQYWRDMFLEGLTSPISSGPEHQGLDLDHLPWPRWQQAAGGFLTNVGVWNWSRRRRGRRWEEVSPLYPREHFIHLHFPSAQHKPSPRQLIKEPERKRGGKTNQSASRWVLQDMGTWDQSLLLLPHAFLHFSIPLLNKHLSNNSYMPRTIQVSTSRNAE